MRRHVPPAATARRSVAAALVATLAIALAACGDEGDAGDGDTAPTIVVTTSVLGDVVENLVGDAARVEVVVPAGVDPHEFAPSARQAATLREADVVVANGGGLEARLDDTLEGAAADGATVFEAMDHVDDPLTEGDTVDPHFFTDPARMATVAEALAATLAAEVPGLDDPGAEQRAAAYVDDLRALDAEVEATLAAVPPERRTLVTNHEVLGYFADRYGFAVVGAVIPATTTQAAASAGEIDALARTITETGVPAVFTDTSATGDLADALAEEVGDIEVVALHTESLGERGSGADTYAGMIHSNATRIAGALAP